MLGIKSNREPIKGAFAKKLREQISSCRKETSSSKGQTQQANTSEKK
jgi:hypothetical protein